MEKTFHYKLKGKHSKPIIPITFKHGQTELYVRAIVDSGADYSIFDASFAEQVGIPVTRFEQIKMDGIAGSLKGNLCYVNIKVIAEYFDVPVLFVKNYSGPFNILGRKGFFERHTITFNEAKLEVKITANSTS